MSWRPDPRFERSCCGRASSDPSDPAAPVSGLTQGRAYSWMLAEGIGRTRRRWRLLDVGASRRGTDRAALSRRAKRPPAVSRPPAGVPPPLSAAVLDAALAYPEALRFEGATVGLDVSLAVLAPLLFGGFAILASFWVLRDSAPRTAASGAALDLDAQESNPYRARDWTTPGGSGPLSLRRDREPDESRGCVSGVLAMDDDPSRSQAGRIDSVGISASFQAFHPPTRARAFGHPAPSAGAPHGRSSLRLFRRSRRR